MSDPEMTFQGNNVLAAGNETTRDDRELHCAALTHIFGLSLLYLEVNTPGPPRPAASSHAPDSACRPLRTTTTRALTCTVPSLKSSSKTRSDTRKRSRQRPGAGTGAGRPSCGDRPSLWASRAAVSPGARPAPPCPHLSQPPLHAACKEPEDRQLGAQRAGHVPRGERFQLPPRRRIADAAGERVPGSAGRHSLDPGPLRPDDTFPPATPPGTGIRRPAPQDPPLSIPAALPLTEPRTQRVFTETLTRPQTLFASCLMAAPTFRPASKFRSQPPATLHRPGHCLSLPDQPSCLPRSLLPGRACQTDPFQPQLEGH